MKPSYDTNLGVELSLPPTRLFLVYQLLLAVLQVLHARLLLRDLPHVRALVLAHSCFGGLAVDTMYKIEYDVLDQFLVVLIFEQGGKIVLGFVVDRSNSSSHFCIFVHFPVVKAFYR